MKLIALSGEDICIKPSRRNFALIWQTSEDGGCYCSVWFRLSRCICSMSGNFNAAYYNKEKDTQLCFSNVANNTVISLVSELHRNTSVTPDFPHITQHVLEFYIVLIAGKASL